MESKKMVLVIDDDPGVSNFLRDGLKFFGYEAIVEADPEKALGLLPRLKLLCVLLDIGLGKTNGIEVLKQIKKINRNLPVVMVTGYHDEEQAKETMKHGALDYVTKPVNLKYLANILALQSPA